MFEQAGIFERVDVGRRRQMTRTIAVSDQMRVSVPERVLVFAERTGPVDKGQSLIGVHEGIGKSLAFCVSYVVRSDHVSYDIGRRNGWKPQISRIDIECTECIRILKMQQMA